MGYFRKTLERRTFSQDRYYILIKRQKAGKATFSELTELDEIVNRVPDIREKVIIESFFTEPGTDGPSDPPADQNSVHSHPAHSHNLAARIKSFFHRVFTLQIRAKVQEFNLLY